MYENLIAFLLGRKGELTDEDLNEFVELLTRALDLAEEYSTLEKQAMIENIVDSVAVKDLQERRIISSAIENILDFQEEKDSEASEDVFVEKSEENVPLKKRKVKRGQFKAKITEDKKVEKLNFAFEIGDLVEEHRTGPEFTFIL